MLGINRFQRQIWEKHLLVELPVSWSRLDGFEHSYGFLGPIGLPIGQQATGDDGFADFSVSAGNQEGIERNHRRLEGIVGSVEQGKAKQDWR